MSETSIGKYPNHFDEAMGLPRIDIAPLAREIYTHGFKKPKKDPINPKMGMLGLIGVRSFNPTPEEALEVYRLGERERGALTAELANGVISRALGHRKRCGEYGLVGYPVNEDTFEEDLSGKLAVVTSLGSQDPFRMLDIHMFRTLSLAHAQEMRHLAAISEIQPELTSVQAFLRLKHWEEFYHKFLPLNEKGAVDLGEEAGVSFGRVFTEAPTGIGSGVRFSASLLRVIPQRLILDTLNDEITPDLLTKTARNSFPLIVKNYKFPYDVQAIVHDVLSGETSFVKDDKNPYRRGHFDPNKFVTKKSSRGYRIDMDDDQVLKEVKVRLAEKKGANKSNTPGCPAGIDIDGTGSAIKKFWDWNVKIGSMIYKGL